MNEVKLTGIYAYTYYAYVLLSFCVTFRFLFDLIFRRVK